MASVYKEMMMQKIGTVPVLILLHILVPILGDIFVAKYVTTIALYTASTALIWCSDTLACTKKCVELSN